MLNTSGLAAAYVTLTAPGGQQTYEPGVYLAERHAGRDADQSGSGERPGLLDALWNSFRNAGAGDVSIVVTGAGVAANTVDVTIQ